MRVKKYCIHTTARGRGRKISSKSKYQAKKPPTPSWRRRRRPTVDLIVQLDGIQSEDDYEIIEGLSDTDLIITNPNSKLKDGTKVNTNVQNSDTN